MSDLKNELCKNRTLFSSGTERKSVKSCKNLSQRGVFMEIRRDFYLNQLIKKKEKRFQEIRPFRKIDDSFKKIIITKDIVQPNYDEYGILTVNIYDFLLDPNCLEK